MGWGNRVWRGPTPVGIRQIPGVEGVKGGEGEGEEGGDLQGGELQGGELQGGELQGGESVKFELESADGEDGFPGKVRVSVVYTAGTQMVGRKQVTVLAMEYEAELVDGREGEETIVNLTNHSYVPSLLVMDKPG